MSHFLSPSCFSPYCFLHCQQSVLRGTALLVWAVGSWTHCHLLSVSSQSDLYSHIAIVLNIVRPTALTVWAVSDPVPTCCWNYTRQNLASELWWSTRFLRKCIGSIGITVLFDFYAWIRLTALKFIEWLPPPPPTEQGIVLKFQILLDQKW
jgi:hypothetical protein